MLNLYLILCYVFVIERVLTVFMKQSRTDAETGTNPVKIVLCGGDERAWRSNRPTIVRVSNVIVT